MVSILRNGLLFVLYIPPCILKTHKFDRIPRVDELIFGIIGNEKSFIHIFPIYPDPVDCEGLRSGKVNDHSLIVGINSPLRKSGILRYTSPAAYLSRSLFVKTATTVDMSFNPNVNP